MDVVHRAASVSVYCRCFALEVERDVKLPCKDRLAPTSDVFSIHNEHPIPACLAMPEADLVRVLPASHRAVHQTEMPVPSERLNARPKIWRKRMCIIAGDDCSI